MQARWMATAGPAVRWSRYGAMQHLRLPKKPGQCSVSQEVKRCPHLCRRCGQRPKDTGEGMEGTKGTKAALHSTSPQIENLFGKGFAVLAEHHKCLPGR